MPSFEVTSVDSLDERGLDGVVETGIVIICQLACVRTFIEAVDQGCVGFGRFDRYIVGDLSSGSGSKGGMTGRVMSQMVSLVIQPLLTIMTCQMQFLGLRHPRKMVLLSRVTSQPVL